MTDVNWKEYTPVPQGTLRILTAIFMTYMTVAVWPHRLTQGTLMATVSTISLIVGWISTASLLRMKTPSIHQGLAQYWQRNIEGYSRIVVSGREMPWSHMVPLDRNGFLIIIRLGGFFSGLPRVRIYWDSRRTEFSIKLGYLCDWTDGNPTVWLSDRLGNKIRLKLSDVPKILLSGSEIHQGSTVAWFGQIGNDLLHRALEYEGLVAEKKFGDKDREQLIAEHTRLYNTTLDGLEAMRHAAQQINSSKRFIKSVEAQKAREILDAADRDIREKIRSIPDARRPGQEKEEIRSGIERFFTTLS